MTLPSILSNEHMSSSRLYVVSIAPLYASSIFVLVLVFAGAPESIDWSLGISKITTLTATEAILFVVFVTVVALVLHPLQVPLVRLFQGDSWPQRLTQFRIRRFTKRHERLASSLVPQQGPAPDDCSQDLTSMSRNFTQFRVRYPSDPKRLKATAFGNRLAAAEDRAGTVYGLDAAVIWPRLYVVLDQQCRMLVDDSRNQVDVAVRLTISGYICAGVSASLLILSGWQVLWALVPLVIGVMAHAGAHQAATAYGRALQVAFDLNRFSLLESLHLKKPRCLATERQTNQQLSTLLSQGLHAVDPEAWQYDHDCRPN